MMGVRHGLGLAQVIAMFREDDSSEIAVRKGRARFGL